MTWKSRSLASQASTAARSRASRRESVSRESMTSTSGSPAGRKRQKSARQSPGSGTRTSWTCGRRASASIVAGGTDVPQ
jgi:hypothetical protein